MPARNGHLEQVGVGGGYAAPAEGVEERGEVAGWVEASRGQVAPAFGLEDAAVELEVPPDVEGLALGVVVGAGKSDEAGLAGCGWLDDFLDEPAAGAEIDELAGFRIAIGEGAGGGRMAWRRAHHLREAN